MVRGRSGGYLFLISLGLKKEEEGREIYTVVGP
jgi:hypothetical protein